MCGWCLCVLFAAPTMSDTSKRSDVQAAQATEQGEDEVEVTDFPLFVDRNKNSWQGGIGSVVMFELCNYFLLNNRASFIAAQAHPPQQQNMPIIRYKRRRTKEIICRGTRPSDIVSDGSAPDDELEGKDTIQDEQSKPKRRRTGGNEVNLLKLCSSHVIFFMQKVGCIHWFCSCYVAFFV